MNSPTRKIMAFVEELEAIALAMPDDIATWRLIRDAGRSNREKAKVIYAIFQKLENELLKAAAVLKQLTTERDAISDAQGLDGGQLTIKKSQTDNV